RDRNVTGVQTCALPISVETCHQAREFGAIAVGPSAEIVSNPLQSALPRVLGGGPPPLGNGQNPTPSILRIRAFHYQSRFDHGSNLARDGGRIQVDLLGQAANRLAFLLFHQQEQQQIIDRKSDV